MITSHQQFIQELAEAAVIVHENGSAAPTAPEIASAYWPGSGGMPKAVLDEVRKRLPEIRSALGNMGHIVVPVSDPYYRVRRRVQITAAQIGACLAIGQGKRQAGILFVTEGDQLAKLIQARHESWVHGSSQGRITASRERLGAALEQGLISQGEMLAITGEDEDGGSDLLELEAGE